EFHIGIDNFDISAVNLSKNFLLTGRVEYEFRTTVVREFHDEESMKELGQWIEGAEKYYLQNFVDRDKVMYQGLSSHSEDVLKNLAETVKPYVKYIDIRGL
ncbi:MAG: anaerobic ribonucleoside-triphosphate reductase activating protein, partial [Parasporobacterium sp.]|nr:anaerobic ribonucleoside-triphosphate reductase activating protein [Parasporobacterium sp.]